jgi:DNA-binding transcriptional regulator YdaS (Cro superfamily)
MRLNLYLAREGISVPAFDAAIGCSPKTVYKYLDGSRFPDQAARVAIARATKGQVTANDFDHVTAALVPEACA